MGRFGRLDQNHDSLLDLLVGRELGSEVFGELGRFHRRVTDVFNPKTQLRDETETTVLNICSRIPIAASRQMLRLKPSGTIGLKSAQIDSLHFTDDFSPRHRLCNLTALCSELPQVEHVCDCAFSGALKR